MNYIDKIIPEHKQMGLMQKGHIILTHEMGFSKKRLEEFCQLMIDAISKRHGEKLIKHEFESDYNILKQEFSNTIEIGTLVFMAKNNLIRNYSNNLAVVFYISFCISKNIADLLKSKGYNNRASCSHDNKAIGILANRTHYSIYEIVVEDEIEKAFKILRENVAPWNAILFNLN
tara:strand:- start:7633 stop:8154 length:522 start_codon:yes stop_codon:yes gene_type:complete